MQAADDDVHDAFRALHAVRVDDEVEVAEFVALVPVQAFEERMACIFDAAPFVPSRFQVEAFALGDARDAGLGRGAQVYAVHVRHAGDQVRAASEYDAAAAGDAEHDFDQRTGVLVG